MLGMAPSSKSPTETAVYGLPFGSADARVVGKISVCKKIANPALEACFAAFSML
jgi:hypothetical protein